MSYIQRGQSSIVITVIGNLEEPPQQICGGQVLEGRIQSPIRLAEFLLCKRVDAIRSHTKSTFKCTQMNLLYNFASSFVLLRGVFGCVFLSGHTA